MKTVHYRTLAVDTQEYSDTEIHYINEGLKEKKVPIQVKYDVYLYATAPINYSLNEVIGFVGSAYINE